MQRLRHCSLEIAVLVFAGVAAMVRGHRHCGTNPNLGDKGGLACVGLGLHFRDPTQPSGSVVFLRACGYARFEHTCITRVGGIRHRRAPKTMDEFLVRSGVWPDNSEAIPNVPIGQ